MDVGKILKKVGGAVFSSVVPGGGMIVDFVNSFLSKDKQISSAATGHEIQGAIAQLPPDKQAVVLVKQFDVEIKEIEEWTNVVKALAEADSTGGSTRPFIAKIMAYLIVFEIVLLFVPMFRAIWTGDFETIKAIGAAWPYIAFAIGIPAEVVRYYFGKRTKEKQSRYSTASGMPMTGSVISDIISAFRR